MQQDIKLYKTHWPKPIVDNKNNTLNTKYYKKEASTVPSQGVS